MTISEKKEMVNSNNYNQMEDLRKTHELCKKLMETPYYKKLGEEGIFAIVETAKSLGIDPRLALGGGLYYTKGKVEMRAITMASLIRSKKHSITKDSKSNNEICILHGKRSDTGDCWSASFSMAEARAAGLIRPNTPWIAYPLDMLYSRALSRLARQLFADIIGNCYVEGEIKDDPNIKEEITTYQNDNQNDSQPIVQVETPILKKITSEECKTLSTLLDEVPNYKIEIFEFLGRKNISGLDNIPPEMYQKILEVTKRKINEKYEYIEEV